VLSHVESNDYGDAYCKKLNEWVTSHKGQPLCDEWITNYRRQGGRGLASEIRG